MDILFSVLVVAGATLVVLAIVAWFTGNLAIGLIGATIVALVLGLNFGAIRDGFKGIIPPPTAAAPSPTAVPTPAAAGGGSSGSSTPPGGQVFKANKPSYEVVYDPSQSGSADLPPKGWWYQPQLPPPGERQAHEVAITLQPGPYRFLGPSCSAWLNSDQKSPFDQGTRLVNHQNAEHVAVSATTGTNESWVFVRCDGGAASGFSFAKR